LKGVKIGIVQLEAQAHGSAGQWAHVGSRCPRDDPVELVAVLQVAVGQREAGYWLTSLVGVTFMLFLIP
jgi:hypothetical protein